MQNLDFDNMNINELTAALKLDKEEKKLLASIENDDWVSVANADRIYGLATPVKVRFSEIMMNESRSRI